MKKTGFISVFLCPLAFSFVYYFVIFFVFSRVSRFVLLFSFTFLVFIFSIRLVISCTLIASSCLSIIACVSAFMLLCFLVESSILTSSDLRSPGVRMFSILICVFPRLFLTAMIIFMSLYVHTSRTTISLHLFLPLLLSPFLFVLLSLLFPTSSYSPFASLICLSPTYSPLSSTYILPNFLYPSSVFSLSLSPLSFPAFSSSPHHRTDSPGGVTNLVSDQNKTHVTDKERKSD